MAYLYVDKPGGVWFNDTCTYLKDSDGKFAPFGCSREPAAGVSRCGRIERSDSRVGSVNEAKAFSNGTRFPPLRDRTCQSLK